MLHAIEEDDRTPLGLPAIVQHRDADADQGDRAAKDRRVGLAEEVRHPRDHDERGGDEAEIIRESRPYTAELAHRRTCPQAHRLARLLKSLHPFAAQHAPDRIARRRRILRRRQDAAVAAYQFWIDERADMGRATPLAPANDVQ